MHSSLWLHCRKKHEDFLPFILGIIKFLLVALLVILLLRTKWPLRYDSAFPWYISKPWLSLNWTTLSLTLNTFKLFKMPPDILSLWPRLTMNHYIFLGNLQPMLKLFFVFHNTKKNKYSQNNIASRQNIRSFWTVY